MKRRVLLDECINAELVSFLTRYDVRTLKQQGWRGKKNGELLRLAASDFDVFVTADQNLQFQQAVSRTRIGVICVMSPMDEIKDLRDIVPPLSHAIMKVKPGQVIRVEAA